MNCSTPPPSYDEYHLGPSHPGDRLQFPSGLVVLAIVGIVMAIAVFSGGC